MEEEIQMYLDEAKDLMRKAVDHTSHELGKIRAGKAMPNMLDGIMVEYYGTPTPIQQVSSINTPDARSIIIKPFERSLINEIQRAITNSDLGLAPQNDGEVVRLNIPPLTEERRQTLVKQAKQEIENGKISVRNIRKDTNNAIGKLKNEGISEDSIKKGEERVQALTNQYTEKLDELLAKKEKEILTV